MWLEDILYGALTSGVNVCSFATQSKQFLGGNNSNFCGTTQAVCPLQKPTVVLLNTALVGCILVLAVLLVLSIQRAPHLVVHVCFLLVLAVGLLMLVNW